ncbi:MAG: hypothetical protein ACI4YB_01985 [Oscillospiraceae bacterium]
MNKENNSFDEKELLFEIYTFTASNGKIYYVRPATVKDTMSPNSEFTKKLDSVGVPVIASGGNPRLSCMAVMRDEKRRSALSEIIGKYVTDENGEPVALESFENDGFTIDDIVLLIKRFAGISG